MKTYLFFVVALVAACDSAPAVVDAAPVAAPAAAPDAAPAASSVLVAGTITVPDGAPAAQAVFVSLKAEGRPGPPLAAKRLPAGPFPLAFEITEADRPMANGAIPDAFMVKVTLDVDGDPMKKGDTDLEAVVPGTKGATGMAVTLAPRQ